MKIESTRTGRWLSTAPGVRRRGHPALNRRGGTLVECAIVLGLLISMTFGMVEFGYCFYCKNILAGAAREGARNAITPGATSSNVTTAVANALASTHWPSSNYTISITDTSGNALNLSNVTAGTSVQVSVAGSWGTLGKGFSPLQLIGTGKQIAGVCVMRKEQ
jgi:Flp pilus assembly protein TadG